MVARQSVEVYIRHCLGVHLVTGSHMHLIPCLSGTCVPIDVYCVCLGGKWSGEWQISRNFGACGATGKFFSKFRETLGNPNPWFGCLRFVCVFRVSRVSRVCVLCVSRSEFLRHRRLPPVVLNHFGAFEASCWTKSAARVGRGVVSNVSPRVHTTRRPRVQRLFRNLKTSRELRSLKMAGRAQSAFERVLALAQCRASTGWRGWTLMGATSPTWTSPS